MLRYVFLGLVVLGELWASERLAGGFAAAGWDDVDTTYKNALLGAAQSLNIQFADDQRIKIKRSLEISSSEGVKKHPVWAVVESLLLSGNQRAVQLAYDVYAEGAHSHKMNTRNGLLHRYFGCEWAAPSIQLNVSEERTCQLFAEASVWFNKAGVRTHGLEQCFYDFSHPLFGASDAVLDLLLERSFNGWTDKFLKAREFASAINLQLNNAQKGSIPRVLGYGRSPHGWEETHKVAVELGTGNDAIRRQAVDTLCENTTWLLEAYWSRLGGQKIDFQNKANASDQIRIRAINGLKALFVDDFVRKYLDDKQNWHKAFWPVMSWQHVSLMHDVLEQMKVFRMDYAYTADYILHPLLSFLDKTVDVDAQHVLHNLQKYITGVCEAGVDFFTSIDSILGTNESAQEWFKENGPRITKSTLLGYPVWMYPGQDTAPKTAPVFVVAKIGLQAFQAIHQLIGQVSENVDHTYQVRDAVTAIVGDVSRVQALCVAASNRPQIAGTSSLAIGWK